MLILLKIIHMFSLFAGGASAIGNGLLLKRVIASGAPPPPMVAQTMGIIGKIGFGAIVLLWLSGIGMLALSTGLVGLGWAFWVKMIGATLALVPITMMTLLSARAQRSGTPPDLQRVKMLAGIARGGVAIAVIFAVIAFS